MRKQLTTQKSVYIFDTDKGLLDHLNKLLYSKGVISVTDATGNSHYLVDARRGRGLVTNHLTEIVMAEGEERHAYGTIIHRVFTSHGFNTALIGTTILQYIVKNRVLSGEDYTGDFKEEICNACSVFNISDASASRDVRYSIKQSDFAYAGIRTAKVLSTLTNEANEIIKTWVVRVNKQKKA